MQELKSTKVIFDSYQKQISEIIDVQDKATNNQNSEKPKPKCLVISMAQQKELQKLKEENQNQLNALKKLKQEYEEIKNAKNIAENNLRNIKFTDCQTAGIISSLRIAKEKAEKQSIEYKEAKEKAEKQALQEKKELVKVKLQLENLQTSMKNSINKAASAQQQVEKAEAELNQHKKIKNLALLNASQMRAEKSKAEKKVSSLKRKVEEEGKAREEAEQRALAENDEKILIEAELCIQMKENEHLLKQNKAFLESKEKTEDEIIKPQNSKINLIHYQ